jgi:hypothetical protein
MSFLDLTAASRFQFGQISASVQIDNRWFSSTDLPFNMQPQTQTNWCWAATATSVSHFYYSASAWTQCTVANGNLSLTVCCNSPVPGPCNVSSYLQAALGVTSNFASMVNNTIGYDAILAELNAGRVIGARIGWSGGGGHFMVIRGCGRIGATEYLHIDDPIYGKSTPTLDEFTNRYQGSGRWTHTYYTKRWPTLKIKLPLLDAQLLSLIEQARPLLALKQGDRDFAIKPNSALAVPHHVFVLSLNDIADHDEPPLSAPASLRVLEVEDGNNRAVYDLSLPEHGLPQLQSMSNDAATIDLLQRGISEAQRIADQSDTEPELRFIRIPALYVEAFWLHFADKTRDVAIPVRALGLFTPHQTVPAGKFFERLREAARERLKAKSESDMAP